MTWRRKGVKLLPASAQDDVPLITITDEQVPQKKGLLDHFTPVLWLSVVAVSIGAPMQLGYYLTVSDNPQLYIQQFFNTSKFAQTGHYFTQSQLTSLWSLTTSLYPLFAPIGAFGGPIIAKRYGRKTALMSNNILLVVGAWMQSSCVYFNSYEMFIIGRIITGINNGATTSIAPMYLSEISPKEIRGSIGVSFQVTLVTGLTLGQVLSLDKVLGCEEKWPQLYNIMLVFALVQVLAIPWCPESPTFLLVEKRDPAGSRAALRLLRTESTDLEAEIERIEREREIRMSEPPVQWSDLWKRKCLRRPMKLALVIAISQQLCGINAINYYSLTIYMEAFPQSALDAVPDLPGYVAVFSGLFRIFSALAATYSIEKQGRKRTIMIGYLGLAVTSFIIAIMLSDSPTDPSQSCRGVPVGSAGNYIAIICVVLFSVFFAFGPGPICWLITTELFTDGPRPKAVGIAATSNWIANALVGLVFPTLQNLLCGWVFLFFFVIIVMAAAYVWCFLPDIENRTFREIAALFELATDHAIQEDNGKEQAESHTLAVNYTPEELLKLEEKLYCYKWDECEDICPAEWEHDT